MHILFITETYPPEINGVARTIQRMCHGLMNLGHSVYLIRPKQRKSQLVEQKVTLECLTTGLPLLGYPGLQFGLPAGRQVHQILDDYPISRAYVATEGFLGRSALNICRKRGIPVLSGLHTNFHKYSTHYGAGLIEPLVMAELRRFHNKCQGTLVPTQAMVRQLAEKRFERLRVWPRGVDTQAFSPLHRQKSLRESWGLADDDLAVVYVGRIAPEKNIDLAFEAFDAIKHDHPTARFILVGDGPSKTPLHKAYPDALFVGTKVGQELAEYYASSDIFLFPSLTETFGNVVLEALASGLAVISYDMAAAGQLIQHGENGMLVPVDDANAFIQQARALADRPDWIMQLKCHAVETASQQGWEKINRLLEGIFESL